MSFVVEVEHSWHPTTDLDERFEFETPEEAAQRYDSEAEEATPRLDQIVEELAFEELRLESLCTETGKKVVAYELKPAGVV